MIMGCTRSRRGGGSGNGELVAVELIGLKDSDFFLLPNEDQVERLRLTLQRLNPNVRVTK